MHNDELLENADSKKVDFDVLSMFYEEIKSAKTGGNVKRFLHLLTLITFILLKYNFL